jgi:hypothetical protein
MRRLRQRGVLVDMMDFPGFRVGPFTGFIAVDVGPTNDVGER